MKNANPMKNAKYSAVAGVILALLTATGCANTTPVNDFEWLVNPPAWTGSVDLVTAIFVHTGPWIGDFSPDGSARLVYGAGPGADIAPEGSFSFEEIYNLLLPFLKRHENEKAAARESGGAVVGGFGRARNREKIMGGSFTAAYSHFGWSFPIADKNVMRRLMYGLRDKIGGEGGYRSHAHYEGLLRKHPLVPGDPPNGGDTPIPGLDNVHGIKFSMVNGWNGNIYPDGSDLYFDGERFNIYPERLNFEEIYNLLLPHLKQGADDENEILQITLCVSDYPWMDWMYIDDKETMRAFLYKLCGKAMLAHAQNKWHDILVGLLKEHPLVPGDPPAFRENGEPSRDWEKYTGIKPRAVETETTSP